MGRLLQESTERRRDCELGLLCVPRGKVSCPEYRVLNLGIYILKFTAR